MEGANLRGKIVIERFFWIVLVCLALAFFLLPSRSRSGSRNPHPVAPRPDTSSVEISEELERLTVEMERLKRQMWRYEPQVLLERLKGLRRRIQELTRRLEERN